MRAGVARGLAAKRFLDGIESRGHIQRRANIVFGE